jgi:tetratricopeptide (TPR) repeat protein
LREAGAAGAAGGVAARGGIVYPWPTVKRILFILAALALAAPARADVDAADAVARDIEWQIKNLAADSAVLRDLAAQKLGHYGMTAADALVRALSTAPTPALARVRELLTRLPLTSPDDPPEVAKALQNYSQLQASSRQETGYRLTSLPIEKSAPALLRIIAYEPNEFVAWQLAMRLKPWISKCRDAILAARLPPRPATLRLLAWTKPESAIERMEQAWAMARERLKAGGDTEAAGLLSLVTTELTTLYRVKKQFDTIETCWRQVADETKDPNAALNLLALLVERNQPQRVEAEWKRCADWLAGDPRALYLLARAAGARGDRQMEKDFIATARSLSPQDPEQHLFVGAYLMQRRWLDLAAGEFQRVLEMVGADERDRAFEITARLRLADIHSHRRQPDKEAEQLDTAIHLYKIFEERGAAGGVITDQVNNLKCRLLLIEAARHGKAGNPIAQEKALRETLKLTPNHPDAVIALVELLRKRGAAQEAAELVKATSEFYRARVNEQPDDAEGYNNLAWLLANTDTSLDEARKFSQKSLELQPDTAAYLDTLAEVHIRLGQPARAVEFQKQAIELEPESLDLAERLKKFEAAAAKAKP